MDNKFEKNKDKTEENPFISETDPEGSYTGNPTMLDFPEQDADDL